MPALSTLAEPSTLLAYLILFFISYKFISYIHRAFFHPLSDFPGPRICSFSRLYEFYLDSIHHGRLWSILPSLHDKYGPIIRIAPDELHIRDPDFFFHLFSFKPLDKWPLAGRQFGLQDSMFGTDEHKLHAQRRAAFGDAFSKGRTLRMQEMVREKVEKACEKVDDAVQRGKSVDLAYLFRAIAAEVTTVWMYGQEYGFFEDEKTTKGLYDRRFDSLFGMTNLGRFIPGIIPMVLIMLRGQIRGLLGSKEPGASLLSFLGFATKMLKLLTSEHGIQQSPSPSKAYPNAASIYLHSSLPASSKAGHSLAIATMAPWSGGWDTTAFALTQGAYLILQSPRVLKSLQSELHSSSGPNASNPLDLNTLSTLPYLNAVIHETLRLMHGALCRITRINPTSPEQFQTWTIPAGTKISMSLPDINLSTEIWGDDAAAFRPERWLPGEKGYSAGMEKYMVTFSRGTRACAGQELAWMELRMIFAAIFGKFDLRISDRESRRCGDDDILPWSDGFTPGCKNMMQWLPVVAKELKG